MQSHQPAMLGLLSHEQHKRRDDVIEFYNVDGQRRFFPFVTGFKAILMVH
jgi:hypothetical protein